ncbi:MAG TPA: haloacid dehalogenase type II, partial [Terriglobales bacterium]|nr:haloacid dehalogenase type II [Terriglobales bacterium]
MINFSEIELLTFDCYGTLIDWESGLFAALRPILAAHGKSVSDADLLALYGEFEADTEAGEYRFYREVLQQVVRSFGQHLGFTPTADQLRSLPDSVSQWKPWPDTVAALKRLSSRYRLAIISNIDDDIFEVTRVSLVVDFQSITTAQQARCYKPGLEIFRVALQKANTSPNRILHVGQSIYHDVVPAQSLGLATVWVSRPSPRTGIGAVKQSAGKPDMEVPDVATL